MKGLVADANIQGQVEYLVQEMQADVWSDFWEALGLALHRFEDVGLSTSSNDLGVANGPHLNAQTLAGVNCRRIRGMRPGRGSLPG
jgi:hypothetical protein